LALKQAVDYRTEVVDEVRIRIEAAAWLTKGITLAVKHDNRRKLRALAAEALKRGLIGIT
jgi:hypothetical protein